MFQGQTKTFNWTNPTTRSNGAPLAAADIATVELWKSTDNGQNYSVAGQVNAASGVPPTSMNYLMENVGTFYFKVRARLTDDQVSSFSNAVIVQVESSSGPPSAPTGLA